MKKILSLLSLLMLCIVGVNAQTTIYSWESPEGTPVETGGTIAYVNGDGDRLNYLNNGNYTICLNGKKANIADETPSANAGHMVITLDEALAAGDEIAITGYITKNESKKSSAYFYFEKGGELESAAFSDEANIDPTFNGSPKTVTVTVPAEAAGSKTITMTRGQTGTNLFITKLVITGERTEEPVVTETKTIGLIPGVWATDGAIYAAYAWNDEGNKWFPFVEASGAYGTQIPDNYTGINIVRLKPATAEGWVSDNMGLNWDNKWNQTDNIDFTAVADKSVITITGWNASDFTISAPVDIDAIKAALQEAITEANSLNAYANDETLAKAISAAQAALASEETTAEQFVAAATALKIAATNAAKTVLQKVVTLAKQFGMDTKDAEALLANEETTVEQFAAALQTLLAQAKEGATAGIAKAEQFFATFNSEAVTALAEEFSALNTALEGTSIDAIMSATQALFTKALPYAKEAMEKVSGYLGLLNNETLNNDIADINAAIEANNIVQMVEAANKAQTDFLAAAPGYVDGIEFALAGYKDAGKTAGADQVEAAIAAVRTALNTEGASIVTVGFAVRNLIVALKAFYEANATYTIAGTKALTATENDWDVVEANNMTLAEGLYTWTAENITVTSENKPEFKVVITDIDGKQTWVPASEEGDDHNWVITPDVVGGEGVYNITITFNAKTQEIGVTGEKVEVEGIIPDGTYYVMNANDGTLINAEGTLDAKGSPITFTFDKTANTYTIEGADIFAGKQWTIADAVEGMSGYYTISTPEGFLAANATALEQIADGTADAAVWILLEKAYWEDIVNSTYTIAGTKNLTGTENDWDIVETNQMTLNDKTGLYEKKFKKIAIDGDNQPEFKVVQTNMEGENIWYPENNWVITTDYVGGEGLYDITITFDPSDFKEIGVIAEKRIVFPENAIVYDFEAAADAGQNPDNKNGSAANGQAFFGWENPEKTDSKRQDYRGYEWAEGSLLPEVCHVWRRSDRINGNVAGNGGLKCPSNKEMAIDGLNEGDKVIIVYDAENATDKEIIWAIGDGTSEGGPGTVRATATINGVEAVTGETTIASGAEILVNSVTPADNGTGYIVFQVKKGMIIQQIAVIPSNLNTYTATFTTNAGWTSVYAYAWDGDIKDNNVVEYLGEWPGTEIKADEAGVYTLSFNAPKAPEKIIFSNGFQAQTADLEFVNGNAYEFTLTDEWAELIAEAQALADADEDAVAIGKLTVAISTARGITDPTEEQKAALQAAVDQFKLDNADQEKDETAKVATDGWKKFDGSAAGVCATQFAPAIDTYDGRKDVKLAEVYEEGATAVNRTGTIIYQDITGLTNGQYKVGFYGNAFFTDGRGFTSTMEDGANDVAYVFANDQKEFITARIATSTTENNFRQFDVEVTDGQIKLGMGKEKPGTNWHTMQIYQLTWFTTAKEVFAQDLDELEALVAEGKALAADETKTNGKAEFEAAVEAGEIATLQDDWLNIPEIEEEIAKLKAAIADFKKANWYIDFAAGEYYIIDVESDLKMAAGHDWGTRGIVNEMGLDLTLTPYEQSRTVTIDSRVSNGGDSHFLGSNLYMDSSSWGWALEYQGFGFYILEPDGGKYINIDANNNLVLSDTPREFIIVSKEGVMAQLKEEMANATAENPVDATRLIKANNFNRNDARNAEAWVKEQTLTGEGHTTNLSGGNNLNNCAEAYHTGFSFTQTISGAPAGLYKLTAQGFYRQDKPEGAEEGFAEDAPVFFIGSKTGEVLVKTGEEDNMNQASESFTNGLYTIEQPIEFKLFADGDLVIGVKGTGENQWVIFDNFKLEYYGPAEAEFYVAGGYNTTNPDQEDIIFGTSWNPTLNKMTANADGTYTWVKEKVDLTAESTIYYKVVADGDWDYAWGFDGNNADYVVGADDNYDVVITFDPKNFIDPTGQYNLTCTLNEGGTTGINDIAAKTIENVQVYNLSGQKVTKARKGLYIINGKKMVVK